ncbi:phosphatidylinositol-specific phospholipase C [Mycobacterium sp.]|uniref:phosphatidylinositol-specific phospholipase C n=1 Tax=Mycobacterium sp. TaxID=1785 RepID=UPI002C467AA9|nr:phosphatidylinositol-specific phospholipase C [Mycobacterium sp.]HTQ16801.1 phosphatidylinositol-specific phospholipase C [Mycobacterium sp.]
MTIRRRTVLCAAALAPAAMLARPLVARADEQSIDLPRWMARLADDAPLSGITIPGTHDSGARFGGVAPVVDFVTALWVQCQNWTVTQQLNAGVRFLDVRCHAEPDGTLRIHHMFVDEQLSLTDVLRECVAFLAANPTEALLMRVQQEASTMPEPQFVAAFERHVREADADDRIYRAPAIPQLRLVRGRIVLMPNKLPSLGGISWTGPLVSIEDDWDMGYLAPAEAVERKWRSVVASLDAASASTDKITISFVSANGAVVPPRLLTDILNPRLQREAARRQGDAQVGRSLGVVLVDFVDGAAGAVQQLASCNRFAG